MEFFNDVTAVVPGQTGAKPPRREIRAGPNKRCNTIYVSAMELALKNEKPCEKPTPEASSPI